MRIPLLLWLFVFAATLLLPAAAPAPVPTLTITGQNPPGGQDLPVKKKPRAGRILQGVVALLLIAAGILLLPELWWVASYLFAMGLLIGLPQLYRLIVSHLKKEPKNQGLIPMGLYFWGLAFLFAGSGVAMCFFFTLPLLPLIISAFLTSLILFVLLWGAPHMYG